MNFRYCVEGWIKLLENNQSVTCLKSMYRVQSELFKDELREVSKEVVK